jgi:murein DD-endopeptidase MepM/ murein hydrolase activator NlpD
MDKKFPIFAARERRSTAESSCSLPLKLLAWLVTAIWRTGVDWRDKRPFLTRATAHLSIVALTLVAILLSGVGFPTPQTTASGFFSGNVKSSAIELQATPLPTTAPPSYSEVSSNADTITRMAVPHTTIPERPRAQVVTYTVQSGDNIFNIAAQFGLTPETIAWSNREIIQDAPWLIQPGIELFIPPVDGILHAVRAGETASSIAEDYDVEITALYNEWNNLEAGQRLREGQFILVPGGTSDEIAWKPPEQEYAASTGTTQYSYGVCSGVTFSGPGANGWFVLPTGSPRVSGWYFHDPRNPTHIGLDYACNTGDPIYAAENGVVSIAGWNGGYGILVEVNHGNGFVTRYGHFSQLNVGCGQAVYQGDLLGYCGSTGWSTGPHLHFEIRQGGVPQNPQLYLP